MTYTKESEREGEKKKNEPHPAQSAKLNYETKS